jgi:hypothetical protein
MGARGTAAGRSAADERRLTRPREARGRRGAGGLPRDAQLGVDVGQVALDGPDAQVQAPRYLLVAEPVGEERQYLELAVAQLPRARPAALRRHWVEGVAAGHTVIRYDARGCGLSDREDLSGSTRGLAISKPSSTRRARPRPAARDVAGRGRRRALPIELEMRKPRRCPGERSTAPVERTRDARAVRRGAEPDSLHHGTTSPATRDVSITRQRRSPRASETDASELTINPAGSPTT